MRVVMVADGDGAMTEQVVKEMQQRLQQMQAEVQRADKRATDAEKSIERAARELNSLRKRSNDSIQIKAENDHLTRLVAELKRSSSLTLIGDKRQKQQLQHRTCSSSGPLALPHTHVLLEKQVLSESSQAHIIKAECA